MSKSPTLSYYSWETNLPSLKQKFTSLIKKSPQKKNKQIIIQLNRQLIKSDSILLEYFLNNYSKKQQLLKASTYEQIQSFFTLLKQNYNNLQEEYLSNSILQEGKAQSQQKQTQKQKKFIDFQINKLRFQKFIKDQHQHFIKVTKQYLQTPKKEKSSASNSQNQNQQKYIYGNNILSFLQKLFSSSHIKVFYEQEQYISRKQQITDQILEIMRNYKSLIQESHHEQDQQNQQHQQNVQNQQFNLIKFHITQQQILQFLTYWLQDQINKNKLYVIYTRTEEKMKRMESEYVEMIRKRKEKDEEMEDRQNDNENINVEEQEKKGQKEKEAQNELTNQQVQIFTKTGKVQKAKSKSRLQEQSAFPAQQLFNKYRQNSSIQSVNSRNQSSKSLLTKQQKLQKMIPQVYTFGCKQRAHINKHTTFDDMQKQKTIMNIEKYMNLCQYLQILDMFSREYLIEQFKQNAINRLTLNLNKFTIIIKKLIETNPQILNKVLSLEKLSFLKNKQKLDKQLYFQNKQQQNQNKIKNPIKKHQLSKYKYEIVPINGKDIQTIHQQLQQKKKLKQQLRKQKQEFILKRKMKQGYFEKFADKLNKFGSDSQINNKMLSSNVAAYSKDTSMKQSYININNNNNYNMMSRFQQNSSSQIQNNINHASHNMNLNKKFPFSDSYYKAYQQKIQHNNNNNYNSNNPPQSSGSFIIGPNQNSKMYLKNKNYSENVNVIGSNKISRNLSYQQKFNPQSLISNNGQQDKLWQEYEKKIWQKDKNQNIGIQKITNNRFRLNDYGKKDDKDDSDIHNESILEQALQKRLQKGNKVLKKIASTNLKYYL